VHLRFGKGFDIEGVKVLWCLHARQCKRIHPCLSYNAP
jgi:hypothetical protein